MMMMGRGALPAIGGVEVMMLGRVRVAGEADGVATPLEQGKERLAILQVLIGLVVEKGADGDVHHDDDERVVRRVREHVAHELELAVVEPALVLAASPGLVRVEPEIVDVIEHEEERLRRRRTRNSSGRRRA